MDGLTLQISGIQKTADFLSEEVKDIKSKFGSLEQEHIKVAKRVNMNDKRITDLERYSRRWNLKLLGVKDAPQEDVWEVAVGICQAVLPDYKSQFPNTINIVHRLGPRLPNSPKPSAILIQFISRRIGDNLWKAAKTSQYIKENQDLRFTEDLSKEDRAPEPTLAHNRECTQGEQKDLPHWKLWVRQWFRSLFTF